MLLPSTAQIWPLFACGFAALVLVSFSCLFRRRKRQRTTSDPSHKTLIERAASPARVTPVDRDLDEVLRTVILGDGVHSSVTRLLLSRLPADKVLFPVIHIYQSKYDIFAFCKLCFSMEVEKTLSLSVLFRNDCAATKFWRLWVDHEENARYARLLTTDLSTCIIALCSCLVLSVCSPDFEMLEVDPLFLPDLSQQEIVKRQTDDCFRIQQMVTTLINRFADPSLPLPRHTGYLLSMISGIIEKKFPGGGMVMMMVVDCLLRREFLCIFDGIFINRNDWCMFIVIFEVYCSVRCVSDGISHS